MSVTVPFNALKPAEDTAEVKAAIETPAGVSMGPNLDFLLKAIQPSVARTASTPEKQRLRAAVLGMLAPDLRRTVAEVAATVVEHVVVVVARTGKTRGRMALADRVRPREVERRALHRRQFARRDQAGVHRRELVGFQVNHVAEDFALASEIEIGVLREVGDGSLVGRGGVGDAQLVGVGEGGGHHSLEVTGIVLFAVFAEVGEFEPAVGKLVEGAAVEVAVAAAGARAGREARAAGRELRERERLLSRQPLTAAAWAAYSRVRESAQGCRARGDELE